MVGEKLRYDPEKRGGGYAWAACLGAVALYDILGKETMSNAFARGREHENWMIRVATIGGTAVMLGHLMDAFSEEHDPVDGLARVTGKLIEKLKERFINGETKQPEALIQDLRQPPHTTLPEGMGA